MSEPTPQPSPPSTQPPARELGMLGFIGVLIGGGCLLFAAAGVVNTAFDLELVLKIYGARTELPDSYEVCAALAATGLILIALSYFGSFVSHKFQEARGKPLVRIAIVVTALGLLAVVGRGLQIAALVNTYGSMLAYYATDGDLEDVKAELSKKPDREALDQAVGRAAQYDNHEALKLLLAAGADFKDKTSPKEHRRCALGGTGPEFIAVAVEHGVTPRTCPDSKELVWTTVNAQRPDDETARSVKLLLKAGWSPKPRPEYSQQTPLELATERKLPKTIKVLEAAQ